MSARYALQVDDPNVIRPVLQRDAVAAVYMLGDLDPMYHDFCHWYVSAPADGEPDTVVLVYTGLSAPAVLTFGDQRGVRQILDVFIDRLPERAHMHLAPDHLATVDAVFALDEMRPMVRMGLRAEALQLDPAHFEIDGELVALGHRDTGDIMALYAHYPDSWFEPHQLSTGHYYGVRRDGRLLSVAGVHVLSRVDKVAALGNIVTHPDARGQGLSTACTAHLCGKLVGEGVSLLALNVERRNRSAMRVYEKLGFRENSTYLEAWISRPLDYRVGHAS